jgi:riboflavin kinase/FMN adenylyltransferase
LLVIPFTRDFSLIEPEDFVRSVLRDRLAVSELYLGGHFAFGRGKRGDLALLKRMGPECGFVASAVEEVFFEGEPISSTRIRTALARGEVKTANAMLGREYEVDGLVAKGDKVGRRIGYPTINLEPENELHPADGVYVTQIDIRSFGRRFDCVTNIGRRPTVYEDFDTTIETFVLDFSANVYGEKVRLFFFDRLREERKFPSVTELSAQIGRDIEETRRYFERARAASGEHAPQ